MTIKRSYGKGTFYVDIVWLSSAVKLILRNRRLALINVAVGKRIPCETRTLWC